MLSIQKNIRTSPCSHSAVLLLFFICFITNTNGQSLKYANLDFEQALSKAKQTNQLLFIQLESDCLPCNIVAEKGLSGDETTDLFSRFICINVTCNSNDYNKILLKYYLYPNYPTSLFIDCRGNYLASLNNFSTSNKNAYIKLAAKAMANRDNPPLLIYTDAIAKNDCNKELLKGFISKLNENEQNFNCDSLLEKYLDELTIKQLKSESELAFLIRSAPQINSRTYSFIRQNFPLFKKVFESMPLNERVKINQKIFTKSKNKAFREKDQNYMYSVSSYLRGMYGEDKKEGYKAGQKLELDFYKEVKDYKTYFNVAKGYYNNYFNKLNIDSIIGVEMNRTIKRTDGAIIRGGSLYQTGNQLNEIAYTIYEFSQDKEQLAFALKLSEKTLKYNVPEFIDTYARILYRFGGKKDAIDWQQKAITISDSLNLPNRELIEALSKMKAGTL